MKRLILVAALVSVAGCATGQNPYGSVKTETCAAGGAIGAGVGAGLGYAVGRDAKGALIGALIGGLLGTGVGCTYGDRITQRHQELQGRESDLDAQIQFARGVNQDTQEYNRQLEAEIQKLDPQIDRLAARIRQGQITQQELLEKRQALAMGVDNARNQLKIAKTELGDLQKFQAQQTQRSAALDAEIKQLEGSVARLEQATGELASMSQRI